MAGDSETGLGGPAARLSAFVDSNVLVRHLTGDPPRQAKRATKFLRAGENLILVVHALGLPPAVGAREEQLPAAITGLGNDAQSIASVRSVIDMPGA